MHNTEFGSVEYCRFTASALSDKYRCVRKGKREEEEKR
jgi:hypothetical protein